MATLATLRNAVSSKLGLDPTAGGAEEVLLDTWLNQGVREVLVRSHCTVEASTMTTTASTWQYQLDTDILAIRHLWKDDANSNTEPSTHVSEQEIIDLHRSSTSSNAAFLHYAVAGSNMLLLWPTPSAVYTINLLYVPRPTEMSSGSHDPSTLTYGRIPAEFHKAIEYYALWQGAEYDNEAGSQYGERYRGLFEDYIARTVRPAIQRKGGVATPQVRRQVDRRRSRLLRENDRY